MSAYQDQELTCKDCGSGFTFTAGEQAFYATKVDKKTGEPFTAPKRCPDCRRAKKAKFFDRNFQSHDGEERESDPRQRDEGF